MGSKRSHGAKTLLHFFPSTIVLEQSSLFLNPDSLDILGEIATHLGFLRQLVIFLCSFSKHLFKYLIKIVVLWKFLFTEVQETFSSS